MATAAPSRKKMRNGMRHICSDGCMFSDGVMFNQQTWNDVLRDLVEARQALFDAGLPKDEAPKLHVALWPRHVGRGDDSEIGKVIALEKMLDFVVDARGPNGELVEGVDLMEGVDMAFDASNEVFDAFVAKVKKAGLRVGDIVSLGWGEGGAYSSDAAHTRMVEVVYISFCKFQKY